MGLWWLCKIAGNLWTGELYEVYIFCFVDIFSVDNFHEPLDCNYQSDIFGTTRKNLKSVVVLENPINCQNKPIEKTKRQLVSGSGDKQTIVVGNRNKRRTIAD
jgi:hypothetical protein